MVHGPWSLVRGPWSMVHGPWYMVHGLWSMVHGPWSMVGWGVWQLEVCNCPKHESLPGAIFADNSPSTEMEFVFSSPAATSMRFFYMLSIFGNTWVSSSYFTHAGPDVWLVLSNIMCLMKCRHTCLRCYGTCVYKHVCSPVGNITAHNVILLICLTCVWSNIVSQC